MSELDNGFKTQTTLFLKIGRSAKRNQGTRLTPEEVKLLAAMLEKEIIAARVAATYDESGR